MSEGYDYTDATAGMDDALERARAAAHGTAPTAELDALNAKIQQGWEGEPSAAPIEEQPSKATGDDAARVGSMGDAAKPGDLNSKALEGPIQQTEGPPTPPNEPWARIKYDLRANDTRAPGDGPLAEKMKAVGWDAKPTEATAIGGPTDWAKLQADLQAAEHQADTQRTIGAALHAAAPGYEPPSNAGAGGVDAAKSAIDVHEKLLAESRQQDAAREATKRNAAEQALRQQQIEASKAVVAHKAQADLLAKAKDQAQNDPNSPESQRARAALRPVFELAGGKAPEGYDGWSAADVEKHAKTLSPVATGATARKKTEAELSDREKALADEAASLEQRRPVLANDPRARKLGITPDMISKMGKADLDKLQEEMASLDKVKPHGAGVPEKPLTKLEDISDPGLRGIVAQMRDYRLMPEDVPSRGGLRDRAMKALAQIEPDYDSVRAHAHKKVFEQQALGSDIVAIDTAREHIKTAKASIPQNADANFVNRAKQAMAQGSGDPEFKPFIVAANFVGHEVAKANGITTKDAMEEVVHHLDAAQSVPQLMAGLDTFEDLMKGKLHGRAMQAEKVAAPRRGTEPSTSGGEAPVVVRSKKDPSRSKLVSRERAKAIMAAPGADEFEVVETPPAHGVK